jgi:hypothetical protein
MQDYVDSFKMGDVGDDLVSNMWPDVQNLVMNGTAKLLKVTGKAMGFTTLSAGPKAAQNFKVIPSTTYKLAFRFQQRSDNTDGEDRFQSWTDLSLTQVDVWWSNLNWIFGSQAGITFDVVSKNVFKPKDPLHPDAGGRKKDDPRDSPAERTRTNYKAFVDDNAENTVFLTGTINSAAAFTLEPLTGKSYTTYMPDIPHDRMATKADPFIVILAHEISHAIQYESMVSGYSHLKKEGRLRSETGGQSTIIGDELRQRLIDRKKGTDE